MNGKRLTVLVFVTILLAACASTHNLTPQAKVQNPDQLSASQSQKGPDRGLATAQEAYDLAVLRYREGVGNYLQVLTTESQLLAQRSLDADLRARALELSINLARALGGGFV
jgi:hypothetical protein